MSNIVSEFTCKQLYNKHNNKNTEKNECIIRYSRGNAFPDLNHNISYVCKVDEEIKHRKNSGLIILNASSDMCKEFIKKTADYSRFIIEPYYKINKEMYLLIESHSTYNRIYLSRTGGIYFNDLDSCKYVDVQLCDDINLDGLEISSQEKDLYDEIINLLHFYRNYHFIYMEINPLAVCDNNKVQPIDFAVKYDTTSTYLWDSIDLKILHDDCLNNNSTASNAEKMIDELDKSTGASLKFKLLNPNGYIWTMISGGGASVLFTDAIYNMGLGDNLGNYGEYSGNPGESYVYSYTNIFLDTMLKSKTTQRLILVIGGAISNFTYVDKTFKGVLMAITEHKDAMTKRNVLIIVRRGGINYKKGLKLFKETCQELNLETYCYGPEEHITKVLSYHMQGFETDNINIDNKLNENILIDGVQRSIKKRAFYSSNSKIALVNYNVSAIQRVLDYDYLCGKQEPSIACIIYPQKKGFNHTCFWGKSQILIPIVENIKGACIAYSSIDTIVSFLSFRSAYENGMDALNHPQIKVIAIIAEGICEQHSRLLSIKADELNKTLLGPATVGSLLIGGLRIGNTCGSLENICEQGLIKKGSVSIVTRSGGLLNEMCNMINLVCDGVKEAVSIGGDRYPGSSFLQHLYRFEHDPDVKLLCMLGEIGGTLELQVGYAVKKGLIKKPIIAWCMGTCNENMNKSIHFGHAGSFANSDIETATFKNYYMKKYGILVPDKFENINDLIIETASALKINNTNNNYNIPRELIDRKKSIFFSSISNETKDILEYNKQPVTEIDSIGKTIGHLLFKKEFPSYLTKFIEKTIILLADHGIAVSSAHNTAVCARSGQNISAAVSSGLLCIHDKHGGALQGAAETFYRAKYKDNISPLEFVELMKQQNKHIPGIGHAYKNSTTKKDTRIQILREYIDKNFPDKNLVDYAFQVEAITLQKKDNLILNVDGLVATALISAFLSEYGSHYTEQIISLKSLNSIFIIARTIGLCSTFTDQKRLKQDLFRQPIDDISYI